MGIRAYPAFGLRLSPTHFIVNRKEAIMRNGTKVFGLAMIALSILAAACSHRSVQMVGTHKVTVSRHGLEQKLHVDTSGQEHKFEYIGLGTTGKELKVTIAGDKVTVDSKEGMLRPGDSVFIGDDGVLVNQLDYGDSQRYLQANNSVKSPNSTN